MQKFQKVLEKELIEFETYFKESVRSKVPLLDRIMHFIVKRKGKQLRPTFVLLSAKLGGPVQPATYRAACLVELLHTATLIHDDVVDTSYERRSFFSINALWKNKIAVLVGDYLLSKGLLLSLEHEDFKVLRFLSEAVKLMSEGELLQMEKGRTLNIKEETYYEIIKGKTSSLLSSSCAAGAATTFTNESEIQKMKLFGEKVGMAFQIKDDLFDYGNASIGKPTGNDIKEKKITLPLIYTLQNADAATKRKIIYIIKNQNHQKSKVQEVIDIVKQSGGIEYAQDKMLNFIKEALAVLHEFPESEARMALENLVYFTTERSF